MAKKATKPVKKTAKPASKKTAVKKKPVAVKVKKPAAKVKKTVNQAAVKKPAIKIVKKKSAKPTGMPERARDAILKVLDGRQAEQIVTIDLRGKSSMADYLIIASGRAARQIAAIADFIRADLAKLGIRPVRTEGATQGDWVLVDAGDVIVHLFRPEVRRFYNIEQIYAA